MCRERKMYAGADLDQGSFASHAVWREAFLFKVPDNMSNEDAGPLMCGGSSKCSFLQTAPGDAHHFPHSGIQRAPRC